MKVLFLLKKQYNYGSDYAVRKAGLYNSARFVKDALERIPGIKTKLEIVVDGNSIDKEVHEFKPDFCILEALWVTGDKLREVVKLHPKVKFIVRVHSKIPFLANEGIAIERISDYNSIPNVFVAFNSKGTYVHFKKLGYKSEFLPNIYRSVKPESVSFFNALKLVLKHGLKKPKKLNFNNKHRRINIGCFGAIRPMKNQLQQAVAAIEFADEHNLTLDFHVNSSRVEQRGVEPLKNLRSLFKDRKHSLVEHDWLPHEDFTDLVSKMDLGMQVSFSETFNIVAADFVSKEIPIIVSHEMEWMPKVTKVTPNSINKIKDKMFIALTNSRLFTLLSKKYLHTHNIYSTVDWLKFLLKNK